jgi:hypothetical protein
MIEKCKMNPSKNIVPDTVDLLKVAPVGLVVSGGSKKVLKGVVLAPSDISRTGIVTVYMKLMVSLIKRQSLLSNSQTQRSFRGSPNAVQ